MAQVKTRPADVPTPLMDALCTVAEALVTDRSVMAARAITLEQLGLDGLRTDSLRRFLLTGASDPEI